LLFESSKFRIINNKNGFLPCGHEIETLEHEQALAQTRKLLEQKSVILYEAAIPS